MISGDTKMKETATFLGEYGKQFSELANTVYGTCIDRLNSLCGGKLSFGQPSVAEGAAENMPAGLSGPFVAALCEAKGDIAGPFNIIVDIATARALAALRLGPGSTAKAGAETALAPEETEAFRELALNAASAIAECLGATGGASLREVKAAASAAEMRAALPDEAVFIFASGKVADAARPILLACGTDLCRRAIAAGKDEQAAAGRQPALSKNLERILKIPVPVIVVLAEKTLSFKEVLAMNEGTVIEFEKSSSETLKLLVNDRKVGLGRVVKVGERFGLRIEEIGDPADIVQKLR